MRKFLKNWGPLAVAIIAVVASICAIYFDNAHFNTAMKETKKTNELTGEANELAKEVLAADQQHAEHAKLSDHLLMLHIRLNDQRGWLNEIPDDARAARAAGSPFHVKATNNWSEAEKEPLDGNFDRVRELIKVAHDNIGKCYSAVEGEAVKGPLPPKPLPPKPVWIGEEGETY